MCGRGGTDTKCRTRVQAWVAKVNAAFVNAVCDHRETKAALLYKVKVLEGDLHTAKQTCKDQEYHMQKKEQEYQAATSASDKAAEKSGGDENERAKEHEKERAAWEREKTTGSSIQFIFFF